MKSLNSDKLKAIDALIRAGNNAPARAQVTALSRERIPKQLKLEIASLALRVDLPLFCVRLLHAVVFPPKGTPSTASDAERADYAMGLIRIGAVAEGVGVLKSVSPNKAPKSYLYRAAGAVAEWNYAAAIQLMRDAIKANVLGEYQQMVCRVNLVGMLVHDGSYDEANKLIDALRDETEKKSPLMHAILLKHWAELRVETGQFDGIEKLLRQADTLSGGQGRDSFYIRKWMAIAELAQNPRGEKALEGIEKVKRDGRQSQNWETLRDCDLYIARFCKDPAIFHYLYFGSPFPHFRKRILELFKGSAELPTEYLWVLRGSAKSPLCILSGEPSPQGGQLVVGQNMHRLFASLASDFYRPFRIATLHGLVFPNDHFNPSTSPAKVFAVIKRLRGWFRENQVPLDVVETARSYRLNATDVCALVIPKEEVKAKDTVDYHMGVLRAAALPKQFSISQARKILNVSPKSTFNYLLAAVQRKQLVRTGSGSATRYEFVAEQDQSRNAA